MDLPPDPTSAQLPTKQGWFPAWRAVDKKSFAAGLGGLLIWLASCIVLGLAYLAILEQLIPNPDSFLAFLFFIIGVFAMPVASAFGLITFLPLLMMQRYLTRAVFVAAATWANVYLLCWGVAVINGDPRGFTRLWNGISPLMFGYGLSIGVIASAIQWYSSRTLRPKMKAVLPARRASIAESLELMAVAALVFVVCRSLFEELTDPMEFWIAVAMGAIAGTALSTLTFGMIPRVDSKEVRLAPIRRMRMSMIVLATLLLIGITIAAWATWLEPAVLPFRFTWDSGVGLTLASLFCGLMFIASAWVGLRWLRYWGWTLQHARGREKSSAISFPNQTSTDSARSTAETGNSA
ncbi:putative signal peptide and transmembrane protein [Rhodopirellula islandica]|uniref:Signal peptide and transmembrane protein n=1 Tax=Rhodopirellula islandica TaxID=595434 RepID=A0A0J1BL45_RHOIS|nr:hypothetical protein [Rhodopirellula islandica]KLU07256.1 putative signal peptide and transmembrane protein [Rhodopirellula islandica]